MQASLHLPSSLFLPFQSPKTSTFSNTSFPPAIHTKHLRIPKFTSLSIKAAASDTPEIDYGSMPSSVFPAEACDTIGGDACDVEMFPETKLKEEPKAKAAATSETVDREYLDYNSPKTVFIGEACDDLGGEFCEPADQSGAN